MSKLSIIKTIIGSCMILLGLLFVPEKVMPGYNIIGYTAVIGMILMLGGLKTSMNRDIPDSSKAKRLLTDILMYSSVFLPLVILLYTNIKYKKKIEEKTEYVSNYKTLKIMTTIVLGVQIYMLYDYIISDGSNQSLTKILTIIFFSILNGSLSLLSWSRVAFFITDGFSLLNR